MFIGVPQFIAPHTPMDISCLGISDIDGDGANELLLAAQGSPHRVLKWQRGALRNSPIHFFEAHSHDALAMATADINGDGREELYLLNTAPQADQLLNFCDLRGPVNLLNTPAHRYPQSGRAVAAWDRRGTGRYNLVIAHDGQLLRCLECTVNGKLVDVAPGLNWNTVHSAQAFCIGPLHEERAEVFIVQANQANAFYTNAGRNIASELHLEDAAEFTCAGLALDADNDGRLDLVLANRDGVHRLMIRQPQGHFRDRATPAFAMPSHCIAVVAADFNNDGREELFFLNAGEPNRLFVQNAAGAWQWHDAGEAVEADAISSAMAVLDADGDGVLELLIAHRGERPLSMFKVPGAAEQNWLRILPRTRHGTPARGASVRLEADGRTQIRIIESGGQPGVVEPVAHFGLGSCASVERIRIQWPDGATQSLKNPAIRQLHDVPYPH